MSHVEDINLEVKDLAALEAAAAELGLTFVRDKKTYAWFGHHVGDHPLPEGFTPEMLGKCEHVIRMQGCEYEIGVARNPLKPSTHTLLFDFWGPGRKLQQSFGKGLERLKQHYGLNAATNLARKKGHSVIRKKVEGGIKLCIAA